ncbi:MAG: ATP-binding protein [Chitinophagaceae bacterium]
MKTLLLVFLLSLILTTAFAQQTRQALPSIDSLEKQLTTSKADTNRVLILTRLLELSSRKQSTEKTNKYAQEGLTLSRKLKYRKGESACLWSIGLLLAREGHFPQALQTLQSAYNISIDINDTRLIQRNVRAIGSLYSDQGEYVEARKYFFKAKKINEDAHDSSQLALTRSKIGKSYLEQNLLDSAFYYYNENYKIIYNRRKDDLKDVIYTELGQVYAKKGNDSMALNFFRKSIPYSIALKEPAILGLSYLGIANLYQKSGQLDSSIFYAQRALSIGNELNSVSHIIEATYLLSQVYEKENEHEALRYYKMATAIKDSLFNADKIRQFKNLAYVEQQRKQNIETAELESKRKLKLYALFTAVVFFFILAIILHRNNRNNQDANALLREQKEEIQSTLTELKTTQSQLIQSEKMASLGELTAGIAHEIQNPLNFVNNFSEVNTELITEMKEEIDNGNMEEIKVIANDIKENNLKINHHGKRADAIVKGMLQHSRTSTGKKELTDINALADEYLRLSYHGLRAKDKEFNAAFKTDFDESIAKIEVIPQDLGRVLLNLYNNAFYSVNEKKKQLDGSFEPVVSVSTKRSSDLVEIRVRDNGTGIPQKILDKIYQPFFTTKPTGQGTGLGLSMSYDIIKAHGGTLKVATKEGEFAEFVITLPLVPLSDV